MGTKALNVLTIKRDNLHWCTLVIEVKIDDSMFVLTNIYNADTEPEQPHTLNNFLSILETSKDIQNKNVVLDGDFNFKPFPRFGRWQANHYRENNSKIIPNNRESTPLRYLDNSQP